MKRFFGVFLILLLACSPAWAVGQSSLLPFCPVGEIKAMHPAITAVPGFLLCDGTRFASGTYQTLYNTIGTDTLPNLQGVFMKGMGSQTIGGVVYSGASGTAQADKMQGHKHGSDYGNFYSANTAGQFSNGSGNGFGAWSLYTGVPATDGTNGTPRTGTITEPANFGVKYWIKY